MAHARLSASAAHRWMPCPGSVRLSDGIARKGSRNAAEGTLAHDIAARCLTTGATPQSCLGRVAERDGFQVACDQEMVDGVQFYVDTLATEKQKGDADWVEVDLTPFLQVIDQDLGGTADHVRFRPAEKRLIVTDFKYGAGHAVDPDGNKQLLLYALGALLDAGNRGVRVKTVTARIIQPRIDHEDGRVRSWNFLAVDLLNFAADAAESAAQTRNANSPLVPGQAQCQWCPAKRMCPELEKQQHALVAAEFKGLVPYDPHALAKALDAVPLVEGRIKAIREFAYEEAMRGKEIPGHKLVAKRAVRRWLDEKAVADWATKRGVDPYEEPKVKSPAQLEKGLAKDEKESLSQMTASVSSGFTLVPESDKRPAAKTALAEEFAVIPGPQS